MHERQPGLAWPVSRLGPNRKQPVTYRWNVHDDRRRGFRGSVVRESWYEEATPGLGLDGSPQPLSDAVLDESAVTVGADGLG
ncbi:hypothetical protein [Streptomyces sp. NBC_01451]|uniref:hypothetical protein n=1 Tax=Streptomyces sp. NBC_01451 TaxID=2903872 RepID=UPI002E2FCDC5|nr:hypothetical protein [Streptomyces sp. NBC_01451]